MATRSFGHMTQLPTVSRSGHQLDTADRSSSLVFHPVNRCALLFGLVSRWANHLPSGAERLLCTLLAVFLLLSLISVQLFLSVAQEHQRPVRLSFCTKPEPGQIISFDCNIKLLLLAWLGSMLFSFGLMSLHFVYWFLTRLLGRRSKTNNYAPPPPSGCLDAFKEN